MESPTVPLESTTPAVPSSVRQSDRPLRVKAIRLAGYNNRDFDRGCPRWKEVCWVVVRSLFFMTAWPLPSRLRIALLRLFGAKVGQRVVIRSRVQITFPWRLTIGDDCWLGEDVALHNLAPIVIGHDVCISQRAFLCTGSHDFYSEGFDLKCGPITVGSHSWIAANVFIAPNVHLGPHAMVTAGSVVRHSIADPGIVSGNPAKLVQPLEITS